MNETVAKNNPDYTKSAKINNNPDTIKAYQVFMEKNSALDKINTDIEALIPKEMTTAKAAAQEEVNATYMLLREAIKNKGGYQDVEAGKYALIVEAKHPEYDADRLIQLYPNESAMCIENAVNVKKLQGLIKGGLLIESELIINNVITFRIVERPVIQ